MKCVNVVRVTAGEYEFCNGQLTASVKVDLIDYDCHNIINIEVICDKCGARHHPNMTDVSEVYDLDKFLTDYIRSK
jgi:hypothetical protein